MKLFAFCGELVTVKLCFSLWGVGRCETLLFFVGSWSL